VRKRCFETIRVTERTKQTSSLHFRYISIKSFAVRMILVGANVDCCEQSESGNIKGAHFTRLSRVRPNRGK
jgi:hypothetical protein